MGMFDTFIAEIEDVKVKMKTKEFACNLNTYRLGDVVTGAQYGVYVYFRTIATYSEHEKVNCSHTVFLVLVNGVYTECVVDSRELSEDSIERILRSLKERWSDKREVYDRWLEFLIRRQQKEEKMLSRLEGISYFVKRAKASENGESGIDFLKSDEIKQFEAGGDLLDIVSTLLKPDNPLENGENTDRLGKHRL